MHFDFVQALREIQREKEIPLEVLERIIEDALVSAYRKHFGASSEIHVEIDWEESRAAVYVRKEVVETIENPHLQMGIQQASKLDEEIKVGDVLDIEVTPEEFGRIAAQTAKQVVVQRIREAERDILFDEFNSRAGEIMTGMVARRDGRTVYVNIGKIEAILPATEQMPNDSYRIGERIKFFIVEVKKTTKTPHVLLSRSHPGLLRKLFELEVPEVAEGLVEIRSVARESGFRSKVAVASRQDNVDPVGACVGHRGSRVQAVVDELRGEKIDIVRWSDDGARYLAAALSPARISEVILDEDHHSATVVVPDSQQSLAIGKEGQNVRLAARLTGWRIDIRSESQVRESGMDEFEEYEETEESGEPVEAITETTEVSAEPVEVEASEAAESAEPVEVAAAEAEESAEPAEVSEEVPGEGE
jgi:N utilization substance protein A